MVVELIGLALLCGACSGTSATPSPTASAATTPTPSPAPTTVQATYTFQADLKSSNEVPAIADAEASCAGKGTLTLVATKLSYSGPETISAVTARFDLQITGCPATTAISLFHIHTGSSGANGSVVVDSGQKATEPIMLTSGASSGVITKTGITIAPDLAAKIIDQARNFYFNVHSQLHGGGVIRGQLVSG